MARLIRYVPSDDDISVVEVMNRCVRGIFLLRPSPRLRSRILGILGRAQRLTSLEIYTFDFQSNHYPMSLGVRDAQQLADFMKRVNQQISVELRILEGWSGPIWEGRYRDSKLEQSPANLASRFRYVTVQGCKAGLIHSPKQWPGASAAPVLCRGEMTLEGVWIDRKAFDAAKRTQAGRHLSEEDFAVVETVVLSKLPGWKDQSDKKWCQWVRTMVAEIEDETRERHQREQTSPLGIPTILAASRTRIPEKLAWGHGQGSLLETGKQKRGSLRRASWSSMPMPMRAKSISQVNTT